MKLPTRHPWIVATTVALVLLVLAVVCILSESYLFQTQKRHAFETATQRARQLEQHLIQGVSSTYALAALVRQGHGQVAEFHSLATELLSQYPGVSALELAPRGVIRQIEPLAGNEAAVGLDLLDNNPHAPEALRAVEQRELTLAGPLKLKQGGVGLSARLPVFLNDARQTFWGFTIALIRIEDYVGLAQLSDLPSLGYAYRLWRHAPGDGAEQTIASGGTSSESTPITVSFRVPNNQWYLSLEPLQGWNHPWRWALEACVALLLAGFAGRFAHHYLRNRHILDASEQQYRLLFTDSKVPMLLVDATTGSLVDGNRAAQRFYGYDHAALCQLHITDINQLSHEQVRHEMMLASQERRDCFYFQHRLATGEVRQVEVRSGPLELDGRRLLYSIVHDVTDRKLLEAERDSYRQRLEVLLNEETTKFRAVVEQSIMGIYIIQHDRFVYANPGLVEMFGYASQDELLALPSIYELVVPEDRALVEKAQHQRLAGQVDALRYSFRGQRKDGSWLVLDAHGRRVDYQGSPAIIGGIADITAAQRSKDELKQLVEHKTSALQQRERDLQAILDNIPAVVGYWDAELRNRFANRAYQDWFGMAPETLLGQRMHEMFGDAYMGPVLPLIDAALHGERQEFERSLPNPQGGERHVRIAYVPDCDGQQVRGFYVIGTDVSWAKAAEQALWQAKESAEAANRAKSGFLATMSHEIRTPLNGVLGMAQLLMMDGLEDGDRKDYARTILDSGKGLLSILNDVLDFSKVEAGRMELASLPFMPEQVLRDTAALFQEAARQKGVQLAVTCTCSATYLGDPQRVQQVLVNLTNNAIKFTEQGCIELQCHVVNDEQGNPVVRFAVQDSGIGIAQEKQALLFQAFSQVDGSFTRRHSGTGLGLAICRSLVHLMGGQIGVQSQEGQGATFWCELPLIAVAGQSPLESGAPVEAPDEGCSPDAWVLVVEDNPTNQKVVVALLQKHGYRTLTAEDGLSGVCMVEEHPEIALVLMDCQMPVMDGLSATREIRHREQREHLPRLPIVALSAAAFADDQERCLSAGMDAFVSKPVEMDELLPILRRYLHPG